MKIFANNGKGSDAVIMIQNDGESETLKRFLIGYSNSLNNRSRTSKQLAMELADRIATVVFASKTVNGLRNALLHVVKAEAQLLDRMREWAMGNGATPNSKPGRIMQKLYEDLPL